MFIIDKHPREVQSNNMKLPLLGIMLVVLVQLGFTAYNAVDRPLESLIAVSAITRSTSPLAPDDDLSAYDGSGRAYRAVAFSNKRRVEAAQEATYYVPRKNAFARRMLNTEVAMQRPFENTTITYNIPPGRGSESDNDHPASYQPAFRTPENRSFVARSAAVVRKPYDWLKTLGSKLK